MKKTTLIRLIFLLLSAVLISFVVIKDNKKTVPTFKLEAIPKVDSFQIFIDEYCKISKTIDSINKTNGDGKLQHEKALKSILAKLKLHSEQMNGSKAVIFNGVKYSIFVANTDSDQIKLHLLRPKYKSSLGDVKSYLESQNFKPLMITNAGMFTATYEPEGLYIEENPLKKYSLDVGDQKSSFNFYLYPNGVFYMDAKNTPHIDTTKEFARLQRLKKIKVKVATQSGPMLVINGRIHQAFVKGSTNYKIRGGVGIISSKKVVFACTVGGSNFYDFGLFMRDVFNCKNALFLDGAISKMYLHDIYPEETGGQFGPVISVSRKK